MAKKPKIFKPAPDSAQFAVEWPDLNHVANVIGALMAAASITASTTCQFMLSGQAYTVDIYPTAGTDD